MGSYSGVRLVFPSMRLTAVPLLMLLSAGLASAWEDSPASPAVPAAPMEAQLVLPSLAGVWVYSNPNAQKVGNEHQWVSARAEITQEGDLVQGDYECTFAVQPGEKLNPKVKFSFYGRLLSEVVSFTLRPPLKGNFKILNSSASELKVSFFIQNAEKQGISFREIPDNHPQPLGRQAR